VIRVIILLEWLPKFVHDILRRLVYFRLCVIKCREKEV
jgi:hypothetical protein